MLDAMGKKSEREVLQPEFLEKSFEFFLDRFAVNFGQLMEQFFLPVIQLLGGLDYQLNDLVAAASPSNAGDARAWNPILIAGLGACRNADSVFFAIKQGHFNFSAEGRL